MHENRRRPLDQGQDGIGEILVEGMIDHDGDPEVELHRGERVQGVHGRSAELPAALHRVDHERVAERLLDGVLAEQRDLQVCCETVRQRRLPGPWRS